MADADVDEPVEVRDYDPAWPRRFDEEARRLRAALPPTVAIEHVGSTAVPGLAAKPVVDILVGTRSEPRDTLAAGLRRLGYEGLGEAGVPGRQYFRRREPEAMFNVHVVALDGPLWRDNLVLRDHLRAHPADARRYGEVKRRAAEAAPDSLLRYSELKAQTVSELLAKARG